MQKVCGGVVHRIAASHPHRTCTLALSERLPLPAFAVIVADTRESLVYPFAETRGDALTRGRPHRNMFAGAMFQVPTVTRDVVPLHGVPGRRAVQDRPDQQSGVPTFVRPHSHWLDPTQLVYGHV